LIKEQHVKQILIKELGFDLNMIQKLSYFVEHLLFFNKKRNLISKNTENFVWDRHILDSAQLVKFIDVYNCNGIADLGSGGGFPGLILAIFYQNYNFHVKLYDKSPIKASFLNNVSKKIGIKCDVICKNIKSEKIESNYIVCRAFKKLSHILNISRENCVKKHKLIIMKGKNAQEEVKKTFQIKNYKYKLEKSITDTDSKIIILNAN
tara:strand:- start:79 stop:699 length:621 start_codon:yes stop_codon:yes gene_type:complete